MKLPFVKVAFPDNDGNLYEGWMLIDTGSVNCILNRSVVKYLDSTAKRDKDTLSILSLNSDETVCHGYDFLFKMGDVVFDDVFYVNPELDFDQDIEGLVGIIGHEFLSKHKYALDYASKTLHSSNGSLDEFEACEFMFPIEFGIKNYNIPVVHLVTGEKEFVLVADSGANQTLVSRQVLNALGWKVASDNDRGTVKGFNNKQMDTSIQKVNLPLLSLGGMEENLKLFLCKDTVHVLPEQDYLMDNLTDADGNPLLPVSGLLSSAFMLKHRWVLDFGQGVMYCKKRA